MFFVFDGIDGAGKSTQIQLFSEWLDSLGHDVVNCSDPGSTPLGNKMREILLGKSEFPIHFRSEMLMFSVARAQLVEEVVRPAIAEGKTVVCDRFFFSTVVYQGYAGDVDIDQIMAVTRAAIDGLTPDATFLFDLPVDIALERIGPTRDRLESRGTEYLKKVRDGFLSEADRWPTGVEVINANRSIAEIQNEIREVAARYLQRKTS
jgi:dTMP kinase